MADCPALVLARDAPSKNVTSPHPASSSAPCCLPNGGQMGPCARSRVRGGGPSDRETGAADGDGGDGDRRGQRLLRRRLVLPGVGRRQRREPRPVHHRQGDGADLHRRGAGPGPRPASYEFSVTAVDGGGLSSMARVTVQLQDINDNRPTFYPLHYAVSLSSQSAPGTSVARVTAFDPDAGENGRVTYRTAPGGGSSFFTLNKDTGVISLSRSLHGKANSVIPMVISAQDGGGLTAPVNARVNISVVAGSVAPPVFEQAQYFFAVSEDVLRGTVVGVVRANSRSGSSKDVFYTISSGDPDGYFTVDPETGSLRTSLPLDHEARSSLDLEVQARSGSPPAYGQTRVRVTVADVTTTPPASCPRHRVPPAARGHGGGRGGVRAALRPGGDGAGRGVPQLSSTFALAVHVQAEDQQGPAFDTLVYRVELREGTPLGTRFLQVRALNREGGGANGGSAHSGGGPAYHLRPDGDAAGFGVAPDSGGHLKRTGSATVRVSVTDENDNPPRLTRDRAFLAVRENLPAGTGFGRVSATDRDSGLNARLAYRLLHSDANFQINSQTGEISTRVVLDREHQSSYQLVVVVQDGGTPPSATGTAPHHRAGRQRQCPLLHPRAGGAPPAGAGGPGLWLHSRGAAGQRPGRGGEQHRILLSVRSPGRAVLLDPNTGELRTSSPLSQAERAEYGFTVTATDRGVPPQKANPVRLPTDRPGVTREPPARRPTGPNLPPASCRTAQNISRTLSGI
ncbi:hypothetical protein ANANG_G00164570 [Anguilla anguilla]|uniref:Cadherin domain-containing protein n=1 Tax=Anguilla anguilla TaxID=7936 RepID=A0A9D3RV33_ANGAN|nr:hypothetical protein ANANG_G00164570 [Anguilla anguilla]